jgi:hypothetical protein
MAIDCYLTPYKRVEDNKLTMFCINLLNRANSRGIGIGAVNPGLGIVLVGVRCLVQLITSCLTVTTTQCHPAISSNYTISRLINKSKHVRHIYISYSYIIP